MMGRRDRETGVDCSRRVELEAGGLSELYSPALSSKSTHTQQRKVHRVERKLCFFSLSGPGTWFLFVFFCNSLQNLSDV